jgi:hypothetical protein
MKTSSIIVTVLAGFLFVQCRTVSRQAPDFSSVSRVDSGMAVSVMLTSYSTTLLANAEDRTSPFGLQCAWRLCALMAEARVRGG